jgi:hypothetical protein
VIRPGISWVRRAFAALGVWVLTVAFFMFTDRGPHPVAIGAATTATVTIVWLCTDAFDEGGTAEWTLYRAPAPDRTFDPRFSRLSQQLDGDPDRQAAAQTLHASLNAVADRILVDKYDVDRARQPAAAREILGPRAWTYLETTPAAGSGPRGFPPQLFDTLDTLESL